MQTKRNLIRALSFVLALSVALIAHAADLTLGGMFTDHAVIQRDKPIAVWGKADAKAKVLVGFGEPGNPQFTETEADADGNFRIDLPALKAGGPYELVVKSGDKSVTIKDILIGDVWICSGQSNMQFQTRGAVNGAQEVAAANFPNMRIFRVANNPSLVHVDEVAGQWKQVSPQTIDHFSAVGYFFGRELHQKLDIPIGLIDNSWGGMPAESYTTREALEADPDFKPILDRTQKAVDNYDADMANYEKQMEEYNKADPKPKRAPRKPLGAKAPSNAAALWNGMTEPISPYAITGVIWYQGETNAGRAYQYRKLFADMIGDWRKVWGKDTPFLFVQLANFMAEQKDPGERSGWAELREAQAMALKLPNTGIATAIDVGDAKDIHPKDKQTVGHRLALDALAIAYGQDVVYQGPTFDRIKIEGSAIRINFKHTDGGLKVKGDKLTGFAIAGEDQKWFWADATIDGNTVIVKSADVPNPVAVRYGWANNPPVSLYNGEGLPALPFRSDDWPGATINNK